MSSNRFGRYFTITTWGESHGPAVGALIDGCPSGIEISEQEINKELARRAPGRRAHTSPRNEPDCAEILSGVFEGKTTGAPICLLIRNQDADSSKYEAIKKLLRPGHANYTYLEKYGVFDHRGGGRASARETAARVAAGAIAKKWLASEGIECFAFVRQIGEERATASIFSHRLIEESRIFCPDSSAEARMCALLEKIESAGDSIGALIEFHITGAPVGLGDPVYEKLEARLAYAMMSIPASKGFEIGEGFESIAMKGSAHNDVFTEKKALASNHAGGTLGGISTGEPIIGRVAFKPTSSIKKTQTSCNLDGIAAEIKLPEGSRHDPCVGIRAVPIVEAMCALVIVDSMLANRGCRV